MGRPSSSYSRSPAPTSTTTARCKPWRISICSPVNGDHASLFVAVLVSSRRGELGTEGVEALAALAGKALNAAQQPVLRQVRFLEHLVDRAAGPPTVVPVRGHRVLVGDAVRDPVAHQ